MSSPAVSAPSPAFGQRLWARLRRPDWPRRLKVTGTGRTYLMVTLGVGIGALNTGNNLLYLLLGLLLGVIVLSGLLSERVLRGLHVERVGADALHAREPGTFRWRLSRERGHAFAIEVREVHAELTGRATAAILGPGRSHVLRGQVTAPRRGPLVLEAVDVSTTWPFGLFAKSRRFPIPGEVLVLPARIRVRGEVPRAHQGLAGEDGRARFQDGEGDLAGLRELADGEDARRIHWLKSASSQKLVRAERDREERQTVELVLETGPSRAALDRRCEELAAQARTLMARGIEVGLTVGPVRLRPSIGPAHLRRLLTALARAGFSTPPVTREVA
ncbi:MAG TPA: DUF58 domain-containing protein [Myxococcaceae bacterium]|nr:DUF58 domain-containing protein [Myxococcaceae bacterium]